MKGRGELADSIRLEHTGGKEGKGKVVQISN